MSKGILRLIVYYVMGHFCNRSLRSRIGTFWRRLNAINVSVCTRIRTRVNASRTCGGKSICSIRSVAFFAYSWLCQRHQDRTSGPSTIHQCHAGRTAPTSTRTFLRKNRLVSSFITVHFVSLPPFRSNVNDMAGSGREAPPVSPPVLPFTDASACISLDACGAFIGISVTTRCSARRDADVASVLSPVLVSSRRRRGTSKISESK
jgi:hypothetical protein